MKKTIVALFSALALTFALSGCGGSDGSASSSSPSGSSNIDNQSGSSSSGSSSITRSMNEPEKVGSLPPIPMVPADGE